MKTWRTLLGNERGVALPLAMILLVVLTMLTLTFMSLGAVEPQISRNLSDGARARQLAESGVEWGLTQLQAQDFSALLATATTGTSCGSGVVCRVLGSGQVLPGLTAGAGTFTVTIRNDYVANDNLLTDLALETQSTADGSGAGSVPNGAVILSSTGTFNGASRTITAVVQRGALPVNAALNLPGVQTDTFTDAPPCSGCYSIDGRNWTRAFRLGDGYEFKEVPAGRYRVIAVIDETTVWDEKVTVAAGKDTTLDLSQATSPVPVAKFAPAS